MSYVTDFCSSLEECLSQQLERDYDIKTSIVAIKSDSEFYGHRGFGAGFKDSLANPKKGVDRIFQECLDDHATNHVHSVKKYSLPFNAVKVVGGEPRYSALFVPVEILNETVGKPH